MPRAAAILLALAALARSATATGPPCLPCAGVRVDRPERLLEELSGPPRLESGARLYVSWPVELDGSGDLAAATRLQAAGGTPWVRLVFRTPAPLAEHPRELARELAEAARLARSGEPVDHFQITWEPAAEPPGGPRPGDYPFLLKRAAVALAGARSQARVLTAPLPPDPGALEGFYGEGVAAYLDGIALGPPGAPAALDASLTALGELDPGRPILLDALPFPADPHQAAAQAAELAARGVSLTFFDLPPSREADLGSLKLVAREFQGDLSYDPASSPPGPPGAWAFVRGEDLALRLVARAPEGEGELVLRLPDPQLKRPERIDPETGEPEPLFGLRRTAAGIELRIPDPAPVTVLRLERMSPEELAGIAGLEEALTVTSERQILVEEILRRLQGFEDGQNRRLDHYEAINTTHLRFQIGGGIRTVEATFRGDFFYHQEEGFDWAWQDFYVNGVKWRRRSIPEIPLIQPEKAAAMPLEIHFTKEYRYRLRGTEVIDGRETWVVDFEPAEPGVGRSLYRGTVWIDRQLHARVRTRAIQLALEGEVISNEETLFYAPLDAEGRPAPWSAESFVLPLRTVGQQLLSVVNATTLVERETLLTEVRINRPRFEERRREVLASDVTMVRDTERGLRYLVKDDDSGERVVKEGFDTTKLFALGGIFFDDALDYPLPLAGLNYFSFDFRGTGNQVNLFFAGALLTANFADPRVRDSRFDLGADLFAIAVPFTDELFRDGRERPGEEVEILPSSAALKLGRTVGSFTKLNLSYRARYSNYRRSDDTADAFVLPTDHLTHTFGLDGRYSRSGYTLSAGASLHRRTRWEPWGLPDNPDFDPEAEDYARWDLSLSKTWHLRGFRKFGVELDYLGGSDLDRFSKYQFGFFGGSRVHGFQSNRVRAEKVWAAHLSYGFEVGQIFRLEGVGDAAWASDDATGLDRELLGGIGLVGTFMGPWQTVVSLDLGVPVAGPDDGFVLYLVFLKLFR